MVLSNTFQIIVALVYTNSGRRFIRARIAMMAHPSRETCAGQAFTPQACLEKRGQFQCGRNRRNDAAYKRSREVSQRRSPLPRSLQAYRSAPHRNCLCSVDDSGALWCGDYRPRRYFYIQAGFSTARAFDLSTGMHGLAIVAGMLTWIWIGNFGRRPLYIGECGVCFIIMVATGIVGCLKDSSAQSWAVGSLIILFTVVYDGTIGPICFAIVAEIPSTRLRVKTVVLALVAYNVSSLITNVLMPKALNPTA